MAQGVPNSHVAWATLKCPTCKVRMRIKVAYLALRGRCPECGRRIPALRPRPQPPRSASTADEPEGLVPEEEEWPEQATLIEDKTPYVVAMQPLTFPEPPPAAPPAPEAGYSLAAAEPLTPVPPPLPAFYELPADPYEVSAPAELETPRSDPLLETAITKEMKAEPPPPLAWPLWAGVYTFPWQRPNRAVWLYLSVDFTLIAALFFGFISVVHSGDRFLTAFVGVLSIVAAVLTLFVAGTYAANCFLAIVEATASGNDDLAWPEGFNMIEGLGTFFHLAWLGCFAVLPIYLFVQVNHSHLARDYGWLPIALAWLVVFPILFLSSLASESRWVLVNRQIVKSLLRHPFAWLILHAVSLGMVYVGVELARLTLVRLHLALLPVLGLVGSACLLIYGRLLGRVGWVLTRNEETKIRVKRRKLKWNVGWEPEEADTQPPPP